MMMMMMVVVVMVMMMNGGGDCGCDDDNDNGDWNPLARRHPGSPKQPERNLRPFEKLL